MTDSYDRLQKDHAENDVHINVLSERQAKREADLRQNLQVKILIILRIFFISSLGRLSSIFGRLSSGKSSLNSRFG